MKKLFSIVLALVLTFALAACGCQAQKTTPATTVPTTVPVTTAPTTMPTTEPTTIPPMDPTTQTNIPDPEVDSSTPEMTEDATGAAGSGTEGDTHSIDETTGNASRMRIQ